MNVNESYPRLHKSCKNFYKIESRILVDPKKEKVCYSICKKVCNFCYWFFVVVGPTAFLNSLIGASYALREYHFIAAIVESNLSHFFILATISGVLITVILVSLTLLFGCINKKRGKRRFSVIKDPQLKDEKLKQLWGKAKKFNNTIKKQVGKVNEENVYEQKYDIYKNNNKSKIEIINVFTSKKLSDEKIKEFKKGIESCSLSKKKDKKLKEEEKRCKQLDKSTYIDTTIIKEKIEILKKINLEEIDQNINSNIKEYMENVNSIAIKVRESYQKAFLKLEQFFIDQDNEISKVLKNVFKKEKKKNLIKSFRDIVEDEFKKFKKKWKVNFYLKKIKKIEELNEVNFKILDLMIEKKRVEKELKKKIDEVKEIRKPLEGKINILKNNDSDENIRKIASSLGILIKKHTLKIKEKEELKKELLLIIKEIDKSIEEMQSLLNGLEDLNKNIDNKCKKLVIKEMDESEMQSLLNGLKELKYKNIDNECKKLDEVEKIRKSLKDKINTIKGNNSNKNVLKKNAISLKIVIKKHILKIKEKVELKDKREKLKKGLPLIIKEIDESILKMQSWLKALKELKYENIDKKLNELDEELGRFEEFCKKFEKIDYSPRYIANRIQNIKNSLENLSVEQLLQKLEKEFFKENNKKPNKKHQRSNAIWNSRISFRL